MIDEKKEGYPNPDRIRQARVARKLSQAELGEMIGVHRQSISQYETGTYRPRPESVELLHKALNFPVAFFYKENMYDHVSPIFFRRFKTAPQKMQEAIRVRAVWMGEILSYLKEFIEFRSVKIYETKKKYHEYSLEEIETIANETRAHWGLGLGPISDMILLLENNGFIVSKFQFGVRELDASSSMYVGSDGVCPMIFLSGGKSAVRSRFDAAHELGHVILHNWVDDEYVSLKENYDRLEYEANIFAGAFLVPRKTILNEGHALSSISSYISLKKRWGVSIQALIRRVKDIGMIGESQYDYLNKQISYRGYRKKEPYDDEIRHETPQVLKRAIELLYKNEIQNVGVIHDNIALPEDEFAMLTGAQLPTNDQIPFLRLLQD